MPGTIERTHGGPGKTVFAQQIAHTARPRADLRRDPRPATAAYADRVDPDPLRSRASVAARPLALAATLRGFRRPQCSKPLRDGLPRSPRPTRGWASKASRGRHRRPYAPGEQHDERKDPRLDAFRACALRPRPLLCPCTKRRARGSTRMNENVSDQRRRRQPGTRRTAMTVSGAHEHRRCVVPSISTPPSWSPKHAEPMGDDRGDIAVMHDLRPYPLAAH
jgi:hypothetical protein